MTGFEVTTADLTAAHAYVCELAGEIRGSVVSVTTDVDSLLNEGWNGTAAAGFATGWQDWRTGAEDVLDALARMAALLDSTARIYDGHEAVTTSALGQLDIG